MGPEALRLAELMRDAQPCVVLTGAGISTESGIPDFRSPTGLWRRFNPTEVGSLQAFRVDPARVWGYYAQRFQSLLAAEARLMLVVGSSLEVMPAAGLPLQTMDSGGRLAIVNHGRTPLDYRAAVRIDAPAGETLSAVAAELAG